MLLNIDHKRLRRVTLFPVAPRSRFGGGERPLRSNQVFTNAQVGATIAYLDYRLYGDDE
jgi:hypothetical protein